jgi:uncharacterized protein (DUF2235 family)
MKRLVVCCDGTWNATEKLDPEVRRSTNVLKLSRAILPSDKRGVVQSVEYVRGIGTGNLLNRVAGGASGKGISSNILQAYQFISNNFERGDHIYLFGFSRGAYTARSLSGFIHCFGILLKQYQYLLPYIYDIYQRTPKSELPAFANSYTEKIDRDLEDKERHVIPIHFLGVWDTVGALGVPINFTRWLFSRRIGFHDTELAPNVDYAYHALAIHEYRKHFRPTFWTAKKTGQKVEQVWFPGAHSDIGGGLAENGLSNAALLWMAGRASSVGLEMDMKVLDRDHFEPKPLAAVDKSRKGIYTVFKPYERLIGPDYRGALKTQSLDEFRHASVMDRLNRMSSTVGGSRLDYEIEVDRRSSLLPPAAVPDYIAGGRW